MMLALSVPIMPTRKILAFAGEVGWLATNDFETALSAPIAGLIVQSGLPFTLSATFTKVES